MGKPFVAFLILICLSNELQSVHVPPPAAGEHVQVVLAVVAGAERHCVKKVLAALFHAVGVRITQALLRCRRRTKLVKFGGFLRLLLLHPRSDAKHLL